MLAEALDADVLLVLTDVPAVMRDFGTPGRRADPAGHPGGAAPGATSRPARWVRRSTPSAGSSSSPATWPRIGALDDAAAILAGKAGTIVTPGGDYGGPNDLKPPR